MFYDPEKIISEIKKIGLFDTEAYLSDNSDVRESGADPVYHYVHYGLNENNRKPFREFDENQYMYDFSRDEIDNHPFIDLVMRNCYDANLSTAFLTPQEIYIYNLISYHNLFDENYYISNNIDLESIEIPLLVHYVKYGIHEINRNPNKNYNNKNYIEIYKDDMKKNEPPFIHYIRNNIKLSFFDKGLLSNFCNESLMKATSKLEKFPFFSSESYISSNKDVLHSDLPPHQHAILYGILEGRDILSKLQIAQILGNKSKTCPQYKLSFSQNPNLSITIGIFYHTRGNCFIKEIANDLFCLLSGGQFQVSLETENTPLSKKPDLCIFCAPHEFFFLPGSKKWEKYEIIKSSIMLNTEQAQTEWFSRGLIYLFMSSGIIDLLYQHVDIFESIGIPSFHFSPIPDYSATKILDKDRANSFFRVLPENAKIDNPNGALRPIDERSIDISFFGNMSNKREKFFLRNADFFAMHECFFYNRQFKTPIIMEGSSEILSRMPFYVSENSKICLNIHRNNDPYFEWQRIIKHGAARGAVVVTEECLPTPLYQEGIHFLVETPRHMPHLISWLLSTIDGQNKMQEIQNSCLNIFQQQALKKSKFFDISIFIERVWKKVNV